MSEDRPPPVGPRPRSIVVAQRIDEIMEAIQRYRHAPGLPIVPEEWQKELNELLDEERAHLDSLRKASSGGRFVDDIPVAPAIGEQWLADCILDDTGEHADLVVIIREGGDHFCTVENHTGRVNRYIRRVG